MMSNVQPTLWAPPFVREHVHYCLLPASLRAANLFLHADGLAEEAVDVLEIQAAVRHALHSTAKAKTSMKWLTIMAAGHCDSDICRSTHHLTCMHTPQCRWLLDSAPPSSACRSVGERTENKTIQKQISITTSSGW